MLVIGTASSLLLTPVVRALVRRWGFLDHPDGDRKLQADPVPLGGGAVVLISIGVAVCIVSCCGFDWDSSLGQQRPNLAVLLASAVVICTVGLLDDFCGLAASHKFMGQFAAAALCVACGVLPQTVRFLEVDYSLGLFAWPFAVFWILGAVNSMNLLDGSDGFASVVAVCIAVTLAIVAGMLGHPIVALLALATAGAVAGFAWFNLPPASIYLGDAGSMLIGLVLGIVTLRGTLDSASTMLLVPALVIWTIPIFDTLMAIVRRLAAGRKIATADREHVHHCLLRRVGSHGVMLLLTAACCLLCGIAAVLGTYLQHDAVPLCATASMVTAAAVSRTFGHHELGCLVAKMSRRQAAAREELSFPRCSVEMPPGQAVGASELSPLLDVVVQRVGSAVAISDSTLRTDEPVSGPVPVGVTTERSLREVQYRDI